MNTRYTGLEGSILEGDNVDYLNLKKPVSTKSRAKGYEVGWNDSHLLKTEPHKQENIEELV